eukprot:2677327-Prymnesium_polylepis.1
MLVLGPRGSIHQYPVLRAERRELQLQRFSTPSSARLFILRVPCPMSGHTKLRRLASGGRRRSRSSRRKVTARGATRARARASRQA